LDICGSKCVHNNVIQGWNWDENGGGKNAKEIAKAAPELKGKGIRVRVVSGKLQRSQLHGDGGERRRSSRGF
jgi:hypothetical protein